MKTTKQGDLDFALENMKFNNPVSIVDIMLQCGWTNVDYFSIRSFDVYFSNSRIKLKQFHFKRIKKCIIKTTRE